jgi:hypothetical protein
MANSFDPFCISAQESKQFVGAILEVYAQYRGIVEVAFGSNMVLLDALEKACSDFINRNSLTE